MNNTRLFIAAVLACLLVGGLATAHAQAPDLLSENTGSSASGVSASVSDKASAGPPRANAAPDAKRDWHVDATFYLWFPGAHGNFGAFGYNLGFKVSPAELLSHANFGLMGVVAVEHKRFVMIGDLLWTPLTVTKTKVSQLPDAPEMSAKMKYTPVVFTPEVGYRLINHEKIKVDGLAGFRYWHRGTTLTISPSQVGNSFYTSKDWVDPVLGARILVPLSLKMTATIVGDAGGWEGGSQLDYQILVALSYKIKPKWALDAAWRYLYVDYGKNQVNSQMAESGIVFGVTYSMSRGALN